MSKLRFASGALLVAAAACAAPDVDPPGEALGEVRQGLGTVFLSSTPPSPSTKQSITLKASAAGYSSVRFYRNADCSGAPFATVSTTPQGTASAGSVSDANATTFYSARAVYRDRTGEQTSPCASYTFTHDTIPPAVPVFTGVTRNPRGGIIVTGTTDPWTFVRIHPNASCVLGDAENYAWADVNGAFTVNASTTANPIYAHSLDGTGNRSACSAGFSY